MLVPIVEGDGEMEAVPLLVRKVLEGRCGRLDVAVAKPKNAHSKDKLVRDLERYVRYAAMTPGCEGILVLLDVHDDCAKGLAPDLAQRSRELNLRVPVAIVCAVREYEAWFLASLETLRGKSIKGKPGLLDSAEYTQPVEQLSGVKEWLTKHMPPGRAYKETTDQAPLTEHIDFTLAFDRSRSFRRLCHAVVQLVQAMDRGENAVTP